MASNKRQSLYIDGLDVTVARFKALPKAVRDGADEEVREIARFVATEAKGAASTRAERKAAETIKAQKNTVSLGGGGRRQAAGSMALGTEFGGRGRRTTQQFRAHRGTQGYFFWPSIRRNSARIKQRWDDLVDRLAAEVEA